MSEWQREAKSVYFIWFIDVIIWFTMSWTDQDRLLDKNVHKTQPRDNPPIMQDNTRL